MPSTEFPAWRHQSTAGNEHMTPVGYVSYHCQNGTHGWCRPDRIGGCDCRCGHGAIEGLREPVESTPEPVADECPAGGEHEIEEDEDEWTDGQLYTRRTCVRCEQDVRLAEVTV